MPTVFLRSKVLKFVFLLACCSSNFITFIFAVEVGSLVYVHDWKTVDLAGVPLTKNGDVSFGQLILETQSDRILYIEIDNPEDLENFGSILVTKFSKRFITKTF